MSDIVASIISSQFESLCGSKDRKIADHEAMVVKFRLHPDHNVEDGYRHLTLLIFGSDDNSISVYAKTDWTVIRNEWSDGESLLGNHEYVEGCTPWVLYSCHDSCWRSDGVECIISEFKERISILDSFHGWYAIESLSEAQIKELKEIRRAKYSGTPWRKVSDVEFKFSLEK